MMTKMHLLSIRKRLSDVDNKVYVGGEMYG